MFIFIACVAFIISDTARAIGDVGSHYVDTAYTLGASRWQVIMKVLVPLAMPSVFNSLRLLFGLAFGYIMLAESIKLGDEAGGLGDIINTSQRRGPREHIYPDPADHSRSSPWRSTACCSGCSASCSRTATAARAFSTRCVRALLHGWEDVKGLFRRRPARAAG